MADHHRPQTARAIARARLHNSRLVGPRLKTSEEVVRWLGAVQAQDFGPGKWSIAQRTAALTEAEIDRAFAAGKILRTHVLRPTWHFVPAADIRWMLELTGPRIVAADARRRRELGLDAAVIKKSEARIVRALSGGRCLTRAEIEAELRRGGMAASGPRLAHLLMHIELHGVICSGAPKGKHQTYALLDERAPPARKMEREEALAELARRYFRSHGPATAKDFRWWASLTLAEIQRGLAVVGDQLACEEIDGIEYWFDPATSPRQSRRASRDSAVYLLQAYDECVVGCSETKSVLDVAGIARTQPLHSPGGIGLILVGDQLNGRWRRTFGKDAVRIDAAFHRPLRRPETKALRSAVERYGEFADLKASVVVARKKS